MTRKQTGFPLVSDGDTLVGDVPYMNLYEESDLISNIKGPYQDKEFPLYQPSVTSEKEPLAPESEADLLPPLFEPVVSPYSRRERTQKPSREWGLPRVKSPSKTQGQLAREEAREDIKRKKSAAYLRDEKPQPAKVVKRQPVNPLPENRADLLAHLADRLRQESYILADMPAVYSLKKEDRGQEQVHKKNSYDFLKKSQVYNYPENKVQKERQMAQELNLTHIEEEV